MGWYLGEGHIALARGVPRLLAIVNDARCTDLSDEVEAAIRAVEPGTSIWRRHRHGCSAISASWHHWPCLFPQHSEGRRHEREIALAPWQHQIVDEHVGPKS